MTNTWAFREKKTKRIAFFVSVLLHLIVLFAVTYGTGGLDMREWIEQIFEGDPAIHSAEVSTQT